MFWRGVLGYLPVNLAQGLVGVLTIVVFTRVLSPADYGVYAVAYSGLVLTHTALFTWTEAAMARFQAQAREAGETAQHMSTLYRAWGLLGLGFPVIAALALLLLPINGTLKWALLAALAAVPVRSLIKMVQERRRADGEVGSAAMLDIVQTVGGFAAGVACAIAGLGGASPLIGIAAVSAISLVAVLKDELKLTRGGGWSGPRARAYAGYGLPVSLSLILSLIIATTDRFVLTGFLGEAATGVYHAGYSLANRTLDIVFIWLGMAGGPALVAALERGGRPALEQAAREQARFMILLTVPAAVGLALVARPLAEVLVGESMTYEAAKVTPWIALGGLMSGLTTYYLHQAFTLGRRTRQLLLAMTLPAGLNLALNLLLVPRFGVLGACWATAASYTVGALASWGLGRGVLALPIPWRDLAKVLLACAPMAMVVPLVPTLGGIVELLAKATVGATVFGACAWVLDAAGVRAQGRTILRGLRRAPA